MRQKKITAWSNIPEKSAENMEAAEILFHEQKYTSAISRIYYALFQLFYKEMLDEGKIKPENNSPSVHEAVYLFLVAQIPEENDFVINIFKTMRGERRKADYIGECCSQEKTERLLVSCENLHKKLLSNVKNGRKVLYGYTGS